MTRPRWYVLDGPVIVSALIVCVLIVGGAIGWLLCDIVRGGVR